MKENKNKILIVVAVIVVLALVWTLFLRGSDEAVEPSQPESSPVAGEPSQPEPEPEDETEPAGGPKTDLVKQAVAILASYQEILMIQQQYTDSCPTEDVIADVTSRFEQADMASEALAIGLLVDGIDPAAVAEAQSYQQEADVLFEQLATLGPEIAARCEIEVPANPAES